MIKFDETESIKINKKHYCVYCGKECNKQAMKHTDIDSRSITLYESYFCECKLAEYESYIKKTMKNIIYNIPKLTLEEIKKVSSSKLK